MNLHEYWQELAELAVRGGVTQRQFKSLFGVPPVVLSNIKQNINFKYPLFNDFYLLWFFFIKNYPTQSVGAVLFQTSEVKYNYS